MRSETFRVPGTFRFGSVERTSRLIVVFARSQTEIPNSADSARDRLLDLTSRVGRDGLPQISREFDDVTPAESGTYVVNREGMPVAAEIILRALRSP